jgi:hypothetical protein
MKLGPQSWSPGTPEFCPAMLRRPDWGMAQLLPKRGPYQEIGGGGAIGSPQSR